MIWDPLRSKWRHCNVHPCSPCREKTSFWTLRLRHLCSLYLLEWHSVIKSKIRCVIHIVSTTQAVRLSRKCRLLRKMGMEVRVRSPLKFEFSQSEHPIPSSSNRMPSPVARTLLEDRLMPMRIDTFLAYMASVSFSVSLTFLFSKCNCI